MSIITAVDWGCLTDGNPATAFFDQSTGRIVNMSDEQEEYLEMEDKEASPEEAENKQGADQPTNPSESVPEGGGSEGEAGTTTGGSQGEGGGASQGGGTGNASGVGEGQGG